MGLGTQVPLPAPCDRGRVAVHAQLSLHGLLKQKALGAGMDSVAVHGAVPFWSETSFAHLLWSSLLSLEAAG